jgi:hypothetical protein
MAWSLGWDMQFARNDAGGVMQFARRYFARGEFAR